MIGGGCNQRQTPLLSKGSVIGMIGVRDSEVRDDRSQLSRAHGPVTGIGPKKRQCLGYDTTAVEVDGFPLLGASTTPIFSSTCRSGGASQSWTVLPGCRDYAWVTNRCDI